MDSGDFLLCALWLGMIPGLFHCSFLDSLHNRVKTQEAMEIRSQFASGTNKERKQDYVTC